MTWQSIKFGLVSLFIMALFSLLIPTTILWARSYFLTDDLHYHTAGRFTRFRTSGGGFWFETRPMTTPEAGLHWQKYTDRAAYPFDAGPAGTLLECWGFLYSTKDYDLLLVAPYWSLAGGLLLGLFVSCVLMSRPRGENKATEGD